MDKANLASTLTQEAAERFNEIAPSFLQDKGKCLIVFPQDAHDLFFAWVDIHRDELAKENSIYDGYADFPDGFFAVRITDTEEAIQRVLTETGIAEEAIQYIVVHKPTKSTKSQTSLISREAYAP